MIQIKDRFTQKIIHRGDFVTIKGCVEDAVQKGINLVGANLAGANLYCANLRDTNLADANLENACLYGANLRDANLVDANLENANLTDAYLRDANLTNANLTGADLYRANLKGANLAFANLKNAYLMRSNLENADLKNSNLYRSNLENADLAGANLENADLAGANLENAYLTNAKMPDKPVILPPVGEAIIGFKKLQDGVVIKVEIPADADRVTTWKSRKCRASALRVIEVMQNPNNILTDHMPGWRNQSFVYKLGELHYPDQFDPDEREDCLPGLHFFMTLEEAMGWG